MIDVKPKCCYTLEKSPNEQNYSILVPDTSSDILSALKGISKTLVVTMCYISWHCTCKFTACTCNIFRSKSALALSALGTVLSCVGSHIDFKSKTKGLKRFEKIFLIPSHFSYLPLTSAWLHTHTHPYTHRRSWNPLNTECHLLWFCQLIPLPFWILELK